MILTVEGDVTKLCPYKDERDDGTVTVTFEVSDGDGPELHDVARKLRLYEDVKLSHEDFTRQVKDVLSATAVTSRWLTAGLTVTCST